VATVVVSDGKKVERTLVSGDRTLVEKSKEWDVKWFHFELGAEMKIGGEVKYEPESNETVTDDLILARIKAGAFNVTSGLDQILDNFQKLQWEGDVGVSQFTA